MKAETLAICVSYEQGYGHGLKRRDLSNPYKIEDLDQDTHDAWAYGYSEGYRHAVDCIEGEDNG